MRLPAYRGKMGMIPTQSNLPRRFADATVRRASPVVHGGSAAECDGGEGSTRLSELAQNPTHDLTHGLTGADRAAVVGAGGGIGGAIAAALAEAGVPVHALARRPPPPAFRVLPGRLDLTDEASIAAAFADVPDEGALRLVVVATGLLHDEAQQPEKTMRALDATLLARSFAVNAIGPALVAKHAVPRMPRAGRSVFAVLSARVGSIEDNRLGGWYGYRAAKAALNQLVRTLAVETRRGRPDLIVVALHPGTVATPLSAPFRPGGSDGATLFTPAVAAGHLLRVIGGLSPADSGGFFAWDGTRIPF